MTRGRWSPVEQEAAYQHFEAQASLRAAHEAFSTQAAPKKPPDWGTFRRWAKKGGWVARRARVQARTEAKTEEALATWRARRAAEIDRGLDVLLKDPEGKRLAALVAKSPPLVAKLLEVADRLHGGDLPPADGPALRIEVAWKQPKKGEGA